MAQSIFDPFNPYGLLQQLRRSLEAADPHYPLQITFERAQREELALILKAAEPHLPRPKVAHEEALSMIDRLRRGIGHGGDGVVGLWPELVRYVEEQKQRGAPKPEPCTREECRGVGPHYH